MTSIEELAEKLRKVEALRDRGATAGEREAAGRAHRKLLERLEKLQRTESVTEHKFTFHGPWSHRLFMAVCRHYGLRPYRYKGQRRTTVMLRVPDTFVEETLWPIFVEYDDILQQHLLEVTQQVIADVFDDDAGDADVVHNLK